MNIDAHQHFWKYSSAEYDWIDQTMRPLHRDFLPADLQTAATACGITGAISVQARQTVEETRWLLELAQANPFIRGVVGWLPLVSANVAQEIERFAANPKLRAVRHVVQAEPDGYMLRDDFNAGISCLKNFSLAYDILVFERQLPEAIAFVDRHPGQPFILDHIAKPRIRDAQLSPWRENLRELSRRPNVCCKISGMVTEADPANWTPDTLRPYLDAVLNAFGPSRLMFGSDWPVCLLGASYAQWHEVVENFIKPLSTDEQTAIRGGTAMRAYGLERA